MGRGIQPDRRTENIFSLEPGYLVRFQAVLLDYDNTLAPWRHELTRETVAWLNTLPVPALVLSNGHGTRIRESMAACGVRVRGDCMKPFTHRIRRFLRNEGLDPTRCLLIGDNLITDIWTGNQLGCETVRVRPLSHREHALTRFWRVLEWMLDRESRREPRGAKKESFINRKKR
jgi:uncharacterized protein